MISLMIRKMSTIEAIFIYKPQRQGLTSAARPKSLCSCYQWVLPHAQRKSMIPHWSGRRGGPTWTVTSPPLLLIETSYLDPGQDNFVIEKRTHIHHPLPMRNFVKDIAKKQNKWETNNETKEHPNNFARRWPTGTSQFKRKQSEKT